MLTIYFEKPSEDASLTVCWDHSPCIGDSVDLTQAPDNRVVEDGFKGYVASIVWWRDGSVRVVLR